MTQQEQPEEKSAFVYLKSDVTKTPVDLSKQAKGTQLVLVTPNGCQYDVVAGVFKMQSPDTPEKKAQIEKMKSWDKKDTKFPNLKISRD